MTLIAARINKAQAALARIHGNRYIANEEYLKKAKDVTGARVAIEEAMVKMGALTGPDPGECKLIGKLVKAAMQIVENIYSSKCGKSEQGTARSMCWRRKWTCLLMSSDSTGSRHSGLWRKLR